jgi:opacity protein-like surface antigen
MKQFTIIAAVALLCAIAVPGAAATNVALRGVGAAISLVDADDIDMTAGVNVMFDLGLVANNVGLETYGMFWQQTEDYFGTELKVRDIAFGGRAKYLIPLQSSSIQPYAGGGLGLHVVTAGVTTPEVDLGGTIIPATTVDETELKLGLDIGAGALFDVSPKVGIVTDVWYTMVSDVSQLSLRGGLMFRL